MIVDLLSMTKAGYFLTNFDLILAKPDALIRFNVRRKQSI